MLPVDAEALLAAYLRARRRAEEAAGAEMFLGIPDRWYADQRWRCPNAHVSRCFLKSEEHGDACVACGAPVWLTFPEDRDGPLPLAAAVALTEESAMDKSKTLAFGRASFYAQRAHAATLGACWAIFTQRSGRIVGYIDDSGRSVRSVQSPYTISRTTEILKALALQLGQG